MNLDETFLIVGVVLFLIFGFRRQLVAKAKRGSWNEAVAQLSHELGLKHLPIE